MVVQEKHISGAGTKWNLSLLCRSTWWFTASMKLSIHEANFATKSGG